ncbi:AAA family ATPase [Clostridium sp. FP2]|uniref:AAA family ATPase n=1 Tax=Clostridium sp. FP2 TaxID=2724481 RepID=UPI001CCD9326|nr:AAA family ATPase [Clostridium sp. FP2]MBZ9623254.1 AAA family ATPase [Clostridium sp. FP2]
MRVINLVIQKVKLENFTVFKDLEINFCKGINVFIGENSTGKTHLLKVLYGLASTAKAYSGDNVYQTNDKKLALGHIFIANYNYNNNIYRTYNSKKPENATLFLSGGISHSLYDYVKIDKEITTQFVFIPAKDMLSHSKGLLAMSKKYSKDMPFDKTLLDIIEKAQAWKLDETPSIAKNIIPRIESILDGKVIVENDIFYILKRSGLKLEFSMEAEGLRKFAMLWQLLMNESITKDTVLIWDEPEANLNPELIPVLVDILLQLQKSGVQIFIATHSYNLAKYFETRNTTVDNLRFYSLYRTEDGVKCDSEQYFGNLKNNLIINADENLLDEVFYKNIGE